MPAPVLQDEFGGFFLAGAFCRTERVLYSDEPKNGTRAGQPVPGLWRVVVQTAQGWEREATFFEVDGGQASQVHAFFAGGHVLPGERVVIQVKLQGSGKFVNATAVHVRLEGRTAA